MKKDYGLFVFEYWDWLQENGYSSEDCSNRELLNTFYYEYFHNKYRDYEVDGLDYMIALGLYPTLS